MRGARTAEHQAPHLLSFRTHQSHETLLQVEVSEKTNEIPIAQALLPCLPLAGRVCTADALHTQTDFHRVVHAFGGLSVLTVKKNQPGLFEALATYFADPCASVEQESTRDDHRGRTERRSIKVSIEMNAYLRSAWPHVAQVAELTRTVTKRRTGETSQEIVSLLTDLTPQEANPQRLLARVRGHWSSENSSHYVRDVTFQEDRSSLRSGHAPQVMAAFRNLAITLIHRQGSSQIAATRRHFASHPRRAFRLLLSNEVAQQSFTSPVGRGTTQDFAKGMSKRGKNWEDRAIKKEREKRKTWNRTSG